MKAFLPTLYFCCCLSLGANNVEANQDSGSGYRNATQQDSRCLPIKREIYRFRHWQWSGIFPFEGGFIPDPHFVCSDAVSFPTHIQLLLRDPSARIQVIDVNPFFKDESKEIVLVIKSNSKLFEFKLDYLRDYSIRSAMGTGYPDIRLLHYEGRIAILAWLDRNLRGVYLIPLPLKSVQSLQLHQVGSEEFVAFSEYFKRLPPSTETKDYFCSTRLNGELIGSNIFISYFRKYRGDCGFTGKNTETYDHLTRYERWWK